MLDSRLPRLNEVGVPPPSGVNFSVGEAGSVPTFCTTMLDTRPTPSVFFAAYGA